MNDNNKGSEKFQDDDASRINIFVAEKGGDVVSIHSIILEIFDKMMNLERKDSLLLFIDTRSEEIFLISTIEKD